MGLGAIGYTVLSVLNPPNAPPPDLPTEEMEREGWVRTAQNKEVVMRTSLGPIGVKALANTVQYGDRGLTEHVRSQPVALEASGQTLTRELGQVAPNALDQYLALLVATRIDLGPDLDNLPLGIGRAEVMGQVESTARDSFVTTMQDSGLENIQQTSSGDFEVATGETGTRYRYQADFPFGGGTATMNGEQFTFPRSRLKMAGYLAVWHHADWIMIGAGAHPDENYSDSFQEELSSGATATISLDFGLSPASYREEILGIIRQLR